MHILYLSAPGGGLDTNVRVLAPTLARAGHRVSVAYVHLPGPAVPKIDEINGCQIDQIQMGHWHYYLYRATRMPSLPRIVRLFEYVYAFRRVVVDVKRRVGLDLIEVPEIFVPPGWLGNVPYVVRLHSSAWMCNRLYGEHLTIADSVESRFESWTLARARGISSPSAFVAGYVRQACRIAAPIKIIPYPIDTTRFTPGERKDDPPVILFVGRVEKRKGADVLMNAIPRVHEISPDARFIFIGQVCEDVKEEIEKITSFAEFLGVRPRDEIVPWYQRASILVAPSLWDNSPNIIYEAMACGTPVVASRVGGIPELVDDGVTGLLVSPGDADRLAEAIVVLLGAGERREAMGSRARERALTEYAVDKILARTLKFYTRQTRTVENPSPEIKSQEL